VSTLQEKSAQGWHDAGESSLAAEQHFVWECCRRMHDRLAASQLILKYLGEHEGDPLPVMIG
jgi:hypothetical protein